jgi:hypothetical protein
MSRSSWYRATERLDESLDGARSESACDETDAAKPCVKPIYIFYGDPGFVISRAGLLPLCLDGLQPFPLLKQNDSVPRCRPGVSRPTSMVRRVNAVVGRQWL